jgi:hypothetical protein
MTNRPSAKRNSAGTQRIQRRRPRGEQKSSKKSLDEIIDEALDESFPASDPPPKLVGAGAYWASPEETWAALKRGLQAVARCCHKSIILGSTPTWALPTLLSGYSMPGYFRFDARSAAASPVVRAVYTPCKYGVSPNGEGQPHRFPQFQRGSERWRRATGM